MTLHGGYEFAVWIVVRAALESPDETLLRGVCRFLGLECGEREVAINAVHAHWASIGKSGSAERDLFWEAVWPAVCDPSMVLQMFSLVGRQMAPELRLRLVGQAWPRADAVQRSRLLGELTQAVRSLGLSPSSAPVCERIFTHSQTRALARLRALGRLHFATTAGTSLPLKNRCQPLLVGPSGVGKTALAEELAASVSASFFKTSPGDWMPVGARDAEPTLHAILKLCATCDRLVVAIDELDKFSSSADSAWSRGVLSEIFGLLDRQVSASCLSTVAAKQNVTTDQLNARLRKTLIVGIGTWQSLWSEKKAVGFGEPEPTTEQMLIEKIRSANVIKEELLLRFAWPPSVLTYPEPEETEQLFEKFGLRSMAEKVGVKLNARTHDWRDGGMRTLEVIATDLALKLDPAIAEIEP